MKLFVRPRGQGSEKIQLFGEFGDEDAGRMLARCGLSRHSSSLSSIITSARRKSYSSDSGTFLEEKIFKVERCFFYLNK